MRESKIETALRLGVEALGGTCEKFTSPGKRGVPDRLVCWPIDLEMSAFRPAQRVEFVETKAPLGRLESWQERDHERRLAMGFNVWVLWNLEEVERYLRMRGKR